MHKLNFNKRSPCLIKHYLTIFLLSIYFSPSRNLILIFLLYFSASTTAQVSKIRINGTIHGEVNGNICLFFDGDFVHKDSLRCSVIDGLFHFDCETSLPVLAHLTMGTDSYIVDVFLDSPVTNLILESYINGSGPRAMNQLSLLSVSGSRIEIERKRFNSAIKEKTDSSNSDSVNADHLYTQLNSFVLDHRTNILSPYLISRESELGSARIGSLCALLDSTVFNSYEYSLATALLLRLQKQEREIGSRFLIDTLTDLYGRKVLPSVYFGKTTLIVFWASWCGPCRKDHPFLNKLYQNYKSLGLQILGISLDSDEEKWKKAVTADALRWPQLIDKLGAKGTTAVFYGLDRIPASMLLDEKGVIISKDPSNTQLIDQMRSKLPLANKLSKHASP